MAGEPNDEKISASAGECALGSKEKYVRMDSKSI